MVSKALLKAQSNEAKEKRKNTRSERKFQQGINNSNFGKIWIKNRALKQSKQITKEESAEYLGKGWEIGRCFNFSTWWRFFRRFMAI